MAAHNTGLQTNKLKNALNNWTFYPTTWTSNRTFAFYFDLHNEEWLYLKEQKRTTNN